MEIMEGWSSIRGSMDPTKCETPPVAKLPSSGRESVVSIFIIVEIDHFLVPTFLKSIALAIQSFK